MAPPPSRNPPPGLRRVSATPQCQKCTGLMMFSEKLGITCYGYKETVDTVTRQQLKDLQMEAQKKGSHNVRASVTFGQTVWTADMEKANQAPFCAKGINIIVPDSPEVANGRVQQSVNKRQQDQMQENGRKKKLNTESRRLDADIDRAQKQRREVELKLLALKDPKAIEVETEKLREADKTLRDLEYKLASLRSHAALAKQAVEQQPSSGPRSRHSGIIDSANNSSSSSNDNWRPKADDSNAGQQSLYSTLTRPLRDAGLLPNSWDRRREDVEAKKDDIARVNMSKDTIAKAEEKESFLFKVEKGYEVHKKQRSALISKVSDEWMPAARKTLSDPTLPSQIADAYGKGMARIESNLTSLVKRVLSEAEKRKP